MLTKKEQRLRRSRQTRVRIAKQVNVARLTVLPLQPAHLRQRLLRRWREGAGRASTAEKEVREQLGPPARVAMSPLPTLIGKRIAEKAKAAGVEKVAFDRSGFAYHGRVKALAEAAREAGLQF
jgi:large subunit ribosomal protein L18